MRREIEESRRQQRAIGGDDDEVGLRRAPAIGFGGDEALGLCDGETSLKGEAFDGARRQAHAAPGRSIRLGDDERDFVTGFEQAAERLRGEFWRAGED
jgi:hypothetical protein